MSEAVEHRIEDILCEWLREHGYDGLVSPGACGCDLSELRACMESSNWGCLAAYKFDCSRCRRRNGCEQCEYSEDYMYVMSTDPHHCEPDYTVEVVP